MEEYGLRGPRGARHRRSRTARSARCARPSAACRRRLPERDLERPARHAAALSGHGHGPGRRDRRRLRGAPPQLPRGGSNWTLNYTAAHAAYPLKCILVARRAQQRRVLPAVPRDGARGLHPELREAGLGQRAHPHRLVHRANLFMALAGAVPEHVQAFTGLPASITLYGQGPDGRFYSDHLFQGGGQGASAHGDGKSALLWPTSAANTSVELFETRTPILVLEKRYLPDSRRSGPAPRRPGPGRPGAEARRRRPASLRWPLPRWRADADGRPLRGSAGRRRAGSAPGRRRHGGH